MTIYRTLMKLTAADLIDVQRLTETWESYVVTWTGDGGNPAIGNGTILGRKLSVGKNRWNLVQITMGSTTTFGSGLYHFGTSDTPRAATTICGPMYILDNGTAHRSAVCTLDTGPVASFFGVTSADTSVSATVPQTFANGDIISALVHFEVS